MRLFIVFFFLIVFPFIGNSQNLIIDDTNSFKKGIYRSFHEFKYNTPSVPLPDGYMIEEDSRKYSMGGMDTVSSGKHINYHLILPDESLRNDSIWGFCDGKNIYYNGDHFYRPQSKFERISYLGRYCYFPLWRPKEPTSLHTFLPNRVMRMGININNGMVFEIGYTYMKAILSKDPIIYAKYKQESNKDKSEKNIQYLREYSESHEDEIKR